jgi:hypothetical protein
VDIDGTLVPNDAVDPAPLLAPPTRLLVTVGGIGLFLPGVIVMGVIMQILRDWG